MKTIDELYSPALIHSVSGLSLISRNIVETYLSGVNHSIRTGFGMEFSQYRPYQPGDDLRMLDWKLAARHDKLFVRQSEIESNTSILFVLDTSASMRQQTDAISKIDTARIIISTLAYLGNRQGDSLGLFAVNEESSHTIPPARKRQQYQQLLNLLVNIKCSGRWPEGVIIPRKSSDKMMIIVLSDFYQQDNELIDCMINNSSSINDIVCIHISSGLEWEPGVKKGMTMVDLETGQRISFGNSFAADEYKERWQKYHQSIRHKLLENHIRYAHIRTDKSIPQQLKLMLDQHLVR